MGYQQAATRIKAESQDGASEVQLPVVDLQARPVPYRPSGNTQLKLYDDRTVFLPPTYGITLTLEYSFERTDYRPSIYDTLKDLLLMYHNGKSVDFLLKYDPDTDTFVSDNTTGIAEYRAPNMIPEITEEVAGIIFEEQARQKQRSIEFRSHQVDYTFSQVQWLMD